MKIDAAHGYTTRVLVLGSLPDFASRWRVAGIATYANSAQLNASRIISCVAQAIAYLGIETATVFVLTAGVRASLLSSKSHLINTGFHWTESLQRTVFARTIAEMTGAEASIAFEGALLQDFMLPVLTNNYLDAYKAFQEAPEAWSSLCEFERDTFGWDHAQVAAFIADRWQFPDKLVCGIFHHHHLEAILTHPVLGKTFVLPVALAGLLPSQIRQDSIGLEVIRQLNESVGSIDFIEMARAVDEEVQTAAGGETRGFSLTEQLLPYYTDSTLAH